MTRISHSYFYPKYQYDSNWSGEFCAFYFGDNIEGLRELCNNLGVKGKVKLIYIDPPYSTGQDFIGRNYEAAYSDRFKTDEEFLTFLKERIILLRQLLSHDGSIYLHIDTKIGHYVKVLMDEIFGKANFRNEITRIKCNPKNFERKAYGNTKDVIFFYSKTKPDANDPIIWNDYRKPLTDAEIKRQFPKIDKHGRRYTTTPLHAKGETRNGPTGQMWKGLKPPKGRHWRYSPDELTRLDEAGLIEWSSTGNPRKIIYADENPGKKIQDVWEFKDKGFENSVYPTEKNQDMLDLIVLQSSKEGDIVLDCFAGSGTTLLSAEKFNRKWIGMDNSSVALYATMKKLFSHPIKSNIQILYPTQEKEAKSDLDVSFECVEKVETPDDLFAQKKKVLEIRFIGMQNENKYKLNNLGLVFSGYKKDNTIHIHKLDVNYRNGSYFARIDKQVYPNDNLLIFFDIHGNECIREIKPSTKILREHLHTSGAVR